MSVRACVSMYVCGCVCVYVRMYNRDCNYVLQLNVYVNTRYTSGPPRFIYIYIPSSVDNNKITLRAKSHSRFPGISQALRPYILRANDRRRIRSNSELHYCNVYLCK